MIHDAARSPLPRRLASIAVAIVLVAGCGSSTPTVALPSAPPSAPASQSAGPSEVNGASSPPASIGPLDSGLGSSPGPSQSNGASSSAAPTPSGSGSPAPGTTASPAPSGAPASSSQTLIAAALASGAIDAPTSLLYRAEALFGDTALPAEYVGAGAATLDPGLFESIVDALDQGSLPTGIAEELRSFVTRPTDPASLFAAGSTTNVVASRATTVQLAAARPAANTVECSSWIDSGAASPNFKIWACAGSDTSAALADMTTVRIILDSIYGPMTKAPAAGMGPPIADTQTGNPGSGGDGRIDVYLLDLNQYTWRDGDRQQIGGELAAAIPTPPYLAASGQPISTSSGFIIVDRTRFGDPDDLRRSLIHEFFHVLQYAHNRKLVAGTKQFWYVEASATWAETYYFRQKSAPVHVLFGSGFNPGRSIDAQAVDYAAYIWPFFSEQENGAGTIFQSWQALETVARGDFKAATAKLAGVFPFEKNFQAFAIRNLNKALLPGDPLKKHYHDLDPQFPADLLPHPIDVEALHQTSRVTIPTTLPQLSAAYATLIPDTDVVDVSIDVHGLVPSDGVNATAMVRIGGTWSRRDAVGGVLHFCRTDKVDAFDYLYLVVDNHSSDPARAAKGDVRITTQPSCDVPDHFDVVFSGTNSAGYSWSGTATLDLEAPGTDLECAPIDPTTEVEYCYALVAGKVTWRHGAVSASGVMKPPITDTGRLDLWLFNAEPEKNMSFYMLISAYPDHYLLTDAGISRDAALDIGGWAYTAHFFPIRQGYVMSDTYSMSVTEGGLTSSSSNTWTLTPRWDPKP